MIEFQNFPKLDIGTEELVSQWLIRIAANHKFIVRELVYTFVDNKRILEINKKFLSHDYFTDIITFDYCKGQKVSGEIFISLDQVETHAKEFKVEFKVELLRVLAHGMLHLIGFDDKSESDKKLMRKEEDKCLVLHAQIIGN